MLLLRQFCSMHPVVAKPRLLVQLLLRVNDHPRFETFARLIGIIHPESYAEAAGRIAMMVLKALFTPTTLLEAYRDPGSDIWVGEETALRAVDELWEDEEWTFLHLEDIWMDKKARPPWQPKDKEAFDDAILGLVRRRRPRPTSAMTEMMPVEPFLLEVVSRWQAEDTRVRCSRGLHWLAAALAHTLCVGVKLAPSAQECARCMPQGAAQRAQVRGSAHHWLLGIQQKATAQVHEEGQPNGSRCKPLPPTAHAIDVPANQPRHPQQERAALRTAVKEHGTDWRAIVNKYTWARARSPAELKKWWRVVRLSAETNLSSKRKKPLDWQNWRWEGDWEWGGLQLADPSTTPLSGGGWPPQELITSEIWHAIADCDIAPLASASNNALPDLQAIRLEQREARMHATSTNAKRRPSTIERGYAPPSPMLPVTPMLTQPCHQVHKGTGQDCAAFAGQPPQEARRYQVRRVDEVRARQ